MVESDRIEFDRPMMLSDLAQKPIGVFNSMDRDMIFADKKAMPELVREYVALIETERTNRMCKCEWIIHPSDVEIPDGHCIACRMEREHSSHGKALDDLDFGHVFQGKRMKRGVDSPECPVHTKSGFLLGFFEWAIENKDKGNESKH